MSRTVTPTSPRVEPAVSAEPVHASDRLADAAAEFAGVAAAFSDETVERVPDPRDDLSAEAVEQGRRNLEAIARAQRQAELLAGSRGTVRTRGRLRHLFSR